MRMLFVILLFLSIAGNSLASSIQILGETHRVWGNAYPAEYDILSTSHQSVFVESDYYVMQWHEWGWSKSETNYMSVYAEAAHTSGAYAGALSTYIFNSDADHVNLNYECYASNWDGITTGAASLRLINLSSGKELYFQDFDPAGPEPWLAINRSESFTFSMVPNNQYELTIFAFAAATEGLNSARMTASFQPVPEPASVLLFGIGLVVFIGKKCRSMRGSNSKL